MILTLRNNSTKMRPRKGVYNHVLILFRGEVKFENAYREYTLATLELSLLAGSLPFYSTLSKTWILVYIVCVRELCGDNDDRVAKKYRK